MEMTSGDSCRIFFPILIITRINMKKTSSALFTLLLLAASACSQSIPARLDTLITAWADQYKFNGTVLVARKGEILLHKGYGYRNVKDSILHDQHSVFQLGSVTKQFTASIVLKLQEERKLGIQDKISTYFPGYPKGDSITITNLLSHTSGIYNYTNDPAFMANEVSKPAGREKMIALFRDKPLQFSPGTQYSYSNSGYSLLGYIIADATGMPYEQVVRRYIFGPLQMTHSGFDFTHLSVPEKATGYFNLTESGAMPAPIVDSSVSYAAGAIYSTTGDLYKWHQSLLQHSIISAASLKQAFTRVKDKYGFGWIIDSIAGKEVVLHGGGIHGFNTFMASVLEDDVCVVMLNNFSNPHLDKISKDIFAILYNLPYQLPKQRVAIDLPAGSLEQYTGVYELAPAFRITFTIKDGKLTGQPTNQSPAVLYAEREDQFFLKAVDAQVRFTRDSSHRVNGMILYQNGREMPGRKMPIED